MRRWDWVQRLQETIDTASVADFDYGKFNCGLFAARCCDAIRVEAEGGAEAELRTHFTDEASARDWVDVNGGIAMLVTERLGAAMPWWRAHRGDLCMVQTEDGPAVGVSTGEGIVLLAPHGIVHLKIDKAYMCWAVD